MTSNLPYTSSGEHPEDRIFADKQYINRLQKHIFEVYDKLTQSLSLSAEGEEHLFDYIFNEEEAEDFEAYLLAMGSDYNKIGKKSISPVCTK